MRLQDRAQVAGADGHGGVVEAIDVLVDRLVLRQSLVPVAGIAAGFAYALLLMRTLSALLYGVGAEDPATYATAGALVALTATLACWWPARRETMREE